MPGFPVIDFHVHFPARRWKGPDNPILQAYQEERTGRMQREWDLPDPEPFARDEREEDAYAVRWAAEVERYGLRRVVFVTGSSNDGLARVVGRYPDRFSGFAFHDPCSPGAFDELQRAVDELGLVGYKMVGPMVSLPFEDRALEPLWAFLADRRLPVLIHFGLLGKAGGIVHHPRISPLSLFPVARAYPEIPFVVPHFGCGYWQELLHLCWSCPNVHVDTSGSNQWMRWMPYPLDLESLFRKAYETVGPKRIIFGTDSSWFPRGFVHRYYLDQLRVCHWLGMKDEDLADIFGGNAARLLGLDGKGRCADRR